MGICTFPAHSPYSPRTFPVHSPLEITTVSVVLCKKEGVAPFLIVLIAERYGHCGFYQRGMYGECTGTVRGMCGECRKPKEFIIFCRNTCAIRACFLSLCFSSCRRLLLGWSTHCMAQHWHHDLAVLPVGPTRFVFAAVFPAKFTDALGVRPGTSGDGAM